MTFRVVTEDVMNSMKEDAIDNMLEEAYYELRQLEKDSCYVSQYVILDEDRFRRDAEMDVSSWVSPYDGEVHEMYWNQHTSRDVTAVATVQPQRRVTYDDGSIVTRRETLYMIRED
jgi:hypothetical protein